MCINLNKCFGVINIEVYYSLCYFLFSRVMKETMWSVSATISPSLQLKARAMTELVITLLSMWSALSAW